MMLTADHTDACLVLYPMTKWQDTEHKLLNLPNLSNAVREMTRLILGNAADVEMDGQGRLIIPQLLRVYAQMDKKIVLVGQGDKFELWDEEAWMAKCQAMRQSAQENIQNDPSLQGLSI